jgi:hypothetical protein
VPGFVQPPGHVAGCFPIIFNQQNTHSGEFTGGSDSGKILTAEADRGVPPVGATKYSPVQPVLTAT